MKKVFLFILFSSVSSVPRAQRVVNIYFSCTLSKRLLLATPEDLPLMEPDPAKPDELVFHCPWFVLNLQPEVKSREVTSVYVESPVRTTCPA